MAQVFGENSTWALIAQTDSMTKFILLGLLVASIVCFAIALSKIVSFHRERKKIIELLSKCKGMERIEDFFNLYKEVVHTGAAVMVLQEGCDYLQHAGFVTAQGGVLNKMNRDQYEHFVEHLDLFIGEILLSQEAYLPVLGVCAAAAPLVGLFGTIWGLIHSFLRISQECSVDITVVAPGIAEALITTLAGLIVAIPALVFFQYCSNQLRLLEQNLSMFLSKILFMVKKTLVK